MAAVTRAGTGTTTQPQVHDSGIMMPLAAVYCPGSLNNRPSLPDRWHYDASS